MRLLSILGLLLVLAWPAQAATTAQKAASGGVPSWVFSPTPTLQCDFPRNRCFVKGVGVTPATSAVASARDTTNYEQWADGHYSTVAPLFIRLTDVGLLAEGAVTNTAVNSNDFSQAAWVKTTLTAALNQTGPDNGANSASSLTATAGNALTLQVPPVVGTTRNFSVAVKCITCTGAIQMTIDNGTTWTALDATNCFNVFRQGVALNTSAYERCTLNGVITLGVGFRIVNNGDAIAVWGAQIAAATTIPGYGSPCPNTASTGTAVCHNDALLFTGSAASAVVAGGFPMTMYGAGRQENIAQVTTLLAASDGTTNNEARLHEGGTPKGEITTKAATVSVADVQTANTMTNGTVAKIGGVFASADYAVVAIGGTVATASTAGALPTVTQISVGMRPDHTGPWNEYLSSVAIWASRRLPNSTLQALTR